MDSAATDQTTPLWAPLEAYERRVLGVLVEKAKTTPDSYPMTLNALRNGCNQKSNRFPQVQLEDYQIEEALESLRVKKAVSIIQGDSRVEKYRHLAYDWLGVSKVELAVMAELLLRGAQTIGELRGRAARMEPIKGMSELGPILQELLAKQLILYLTPPGRGAVVTHNLYQPRELEKVCRDYGGVPSIQPSPQVAPISESLVDSAEETAEAATGAGPDQPYRAPEAAVSQPASKTTASTEDADELRGELRSLKEEITELQIEYQSRISELQSDLDGIKQRLGI